MTPILFLDFDGVVNNDASLRDKRSIDRGNVANLNLICDAAAPRIVVSSTWRLYHPLDKLQAFLDFYGFRGALDDCTINLEDYGRGDRGDEILEWLTRTGTTKHPHVILDDNAIGPDPAARGLLLIQTDAGLGLTEALALKAIDALRRQ